MATWTRRMRRFLLNNGAASPSRPCAGKYCKTSKPPRFTNFGQEPKVGRFATKIGRLASQRHKWHLERASGNALQARTRGPYYTIPTLLCGLLSPKNPALSQRLAVIVTKVGRQEQQQPCLAPIVALKTFCERLRIRGQALWQTVRPTAKVSGNALAPCW